MLPLSRSSTPAVSRPRFQVLARRPVANMTTSKGAVTPSLEDVFLDVVERVGAA